MNQATHLPRDEEETFREREEFAYFLIQELAFVPEVLLQYGHGKLPWNNIAIFLDHYYPDALYGPFRHQSYSQ